MEFKPLHKMGVLLTVLFLWGKASISPMDDPDLPGPGDPKRFDAPEGVNFRR